MESRAKLALSPRERQILDLMVSGLTYDQTARRLGISVHTVGTHVRRIRAKYAPTTMADLIRMRLLETDEPTSRLNRGVFQ